MAKKVLKEWFPDKEEFRELEDLAKTQKQIYSDAADIGLIWTPQLNDKIKKLLTVLKGTYGGRAEKWGTEKMGGASYMIFIPIEAADYQQGKYDGIFLTVSLHHDPILNRRYGQGTDKFYSIDIERKTLSPREAESQYNSTFFKKQESKFKFEEIIKEEVASFFDEALTIKEQGAENEFYSSVTIDMDDMAKVSWGVVANKEEAANISTTSKQKVPIKWSVDFEYRKYGIKAIMPTVPDQRISAEFERDTEQGSVPFSKDIEIRDVQVEIKVLNEMRSSFQLWPYEIEFTNTSVIVKFTL